MGARRVRHGLAEYFQHDGGGVAPFDLAFGDPVITTFACAIELRLLDLGGGWVTRCRRQPGDPLGATRGLQRLGSCDLPAPPGLHGLAYGSSVWGPGRCVALWEQGAAAFPDAPLAARRLDDPALAAAVADAEERLRPPGVAFPA